MFFYLSKVLLFLTMPLTWVFIFILLAFLLKKGKWKKPLLILAAVWLFVFSNTFIADEFCRRWEIKATPDENLATYDLGIILGGMSGWDASLRRIQFHNSGDRLWHGLRLYKIGKAKKLLITGGSASLSNPQYKEADFIADYLRTIGLSDHNIFYENQSRNTYENAIYSREAIKRNQLKGKILLITSGMHMRRALMCFQKAGIPVEPYSVDRATGPRRYDLAVLLLPSWEALAKWNGLAKEWIGVVVYKMRGYC